LQASSSWVLTAFNDTPIWGVVPRTSTTTPAWLVGKQLNTWFQIPNTTHAGSPADPTDSPLDTFCRSNRRLAYSGAALRDAELWLPAVGGHQDYSGNEVTSIDLSADAPKWQLRKAKSSTTTRDVPYQPDGTPSSRHVYWSAQWCAPRNRIMLHYSRFVWGSGISFVNSNGFNPTTNTWDAAGTWSAGTSAMCVDSNGDAWAFSSAFDLSKWSQATDTWAVTLHSGAQLGYPPLVYDSKRDHLFSLAWGDGQANGSGTNAAKFTSGGTVRTAITINPSAAYTQWQSNAPMYAGMEYDADNDRYLFYEGNAGREGVIYVITPNATSSWDMSVLALGSSSVTPGPMFGAGAMTRFRYIAGLKGCVAMHAGNQNLYFIRTA
jgi:hypothetical protein